MKHVSITLLLFYFLFFYGLVLLFQPPYAISNAQAEITPTPMIEYENDKLETENQSNFQQNLPKDDWDKLEIFAGTLSAFLTVVIGMLGIIATFIYSNVQSKHSNEELRNQQIQTIQTLLPNLVSENVSEATSALLSLYHLKESILLREFSTVLQTSSLIGALFKMAFVDEIPLKVPQKTTQSNQQLIDEGRRITAENLIKDIFIDHMGAIVTITPRGSDYQFSGCIVSISGDIVTSAHPQFNWEQANQIDIEYKGNKQQANFINYSLNKTLVRLSMIIEPNNVFDYLRIGKLEDQQEVAIFMGESQNFLIGIVMNPLDNGEIPIRIPQNLVSKTDIFLGSPVIDNTKSILGIISMIQTDNQSGYVTHVFCQRIAS